MLKNRKKRPLRASYLKSRKLLTIAFLFCLSIFFLMFYQNPSENNQANKNSTINDENDQANKVTTIKDDL